MKEKYPARLRDRWISTMDLRGDKDRQARFCADRSARSFRVGWALLEQIDHWQAADASDKEVSMG